MTGPDVIPLGPPSPSPTAWPDTPLPDDLKLDLEVVAEGLDQPASVTAPPGDPRLFVVEKTRSVRIVEDGKHNPKPFLNIRTRVRAGGPTAELGMYALAFHPDYALNGRFYVHYTARPDGDTRVLRPEHPCCDDHVPARCRDHGRRHRRTADA